MVFKYKWSDKENGNFAIRKRKEKGIEAGKRIEPRTNQTSTTHFFILVEKNDDNMYNLILINNILKTIEYDYRQKGTDKKGNSYLTKKDIENVLNNIDQYKSENKNIKIETASSRAIEREKMKKEKEALKKWEVIFNTLLNVNYIDYDIDYDYKEDYKNMISLLVDNLKNDNELKLKKLELKKKIIQLNNEIKNINNNILEFEKNIQKRKKENEKMIYNKTKNLLKVLHFSDDNKILNFTDLLNEVLYKLAKKEIRNEKAKENQQKYRDRKNLKNGKPKRKAGRPIKTNK